MSYKFKCDPIAAVEKEAPLWNPYDDGDQWKKNRSLKTGSDAQKPWIFDENLRFLSVDESKSTRFSNFGSEPGVLCAIAPEEHERSSSEETSAVSPQAEIGKKHMNPPSELQTKKRRVQLLEKGLESVQETATLLKNRISNSDRYERFGLMVAGVLRDMPPERTDSRMKVISSLLFEGTP